MSACVEITYRAECYECGWWSEKHEYRSEAQAEADKHDASVDHEICARKGAEQ